MGTAVSSCSQLPNSLGLEWGQSGGPEALAPLDSLALPLNVCGAHPGLFISLGFSFLYAKCMQNKSHIMELL